MSKNTPEGKVKAKLTAMLKTKAPHVWWTSPIATQYTKAGVPDVLLCVCGIFVGVEVKASPSKSLTPHQEREGWAINEAGGKFWVVNCKEKIEQLEGFIDDCIGRTKGSCA
jgi:hypothetical protein